MDRPPIEAVKKAFEEKRDAFFCHISNGTLETIIALCNYTLELEAEKKELQDEGMPTSHKEAISWIRRLIEKCESIMESYIRMIEQVRGGLK